MEQLTVRWHGHACFSLTCRDFTVVLDPYEDHYVPGFPPLRLTGDLVLCSHQHNDHNAAEIVTLRTGRPNPFRITKIPTFHDPEGGRLRGENTIHLLEVGKLRVAHFGDLGCPLSPAQKAELQGLDAAMVPVGGFYTIGPQEAKALLDDLRPKVFCPCTTGWAPWACRRWARWRIFCPWWRIMYTTPPTPSPLTKGPSPRSRFFTAPCKGTQTAGRCFHRPAVLFWCYRGAGDSVLPHHLTGILGGVGV